MCKCDTMSSLSVPDGSVLYDTWGTFKLLYCERCGQWWQKQEALFREGGEVHSRIQWTKWYKELIPRRDINYQGWSDAHTRILRRWREQVDS